MRTVNDEPERFYNEAAAARNRLMHGDEVHTIEASLKIDFSKLVDALGMDRAGAAAIANW